MNIRSLFVQDSLGNPSRLDDPEFDGKSTMARARDYIGQFGGPPDYRADDSETLFVRLVMFDQLRAAYGRDLFRNPTRAARAGPLPESASDQDKVDYLIRSICTLTGQDLRGFFRRWGLNSSDKVVSEIGRMDLSRPPVDPAQIF